MVRHHRSAFVLGVVMAGRSLLAAEFFVSPTGSDHGNGSKNSPWSLAKALSHPKVVQPGDTIWLLGGTYTGAYTSHLTGTAKAPIVVRQYPGQQATLDGNVNPALRGTGPAVLAVMGGYTWFWGFEVTNSNPLRTDTIPCTYCRGDGIDVFAPGTRIINCVVHDTGQGIGFWSPAVDSELYGNIIYYNGWNAPDRAHGHGIYAQNPSGTKKIRHNILFDPFGYNLHAYGSSAVGFVNSLVEGNVWWRGTALVGGKNGFDISGTSIKGNFCWSASLETGYSTTKCSNVTVSENYLTNLEGVAFSPGNIGCLAGESITTNTFVGLLNNFRPSDYPNNTYYQNTNPPTQAKAFTLANEYEPGRATIVVYNWSGTANQPVELSRVLSPGAAYEIHNAQNFFGPPVASGTHSEGTVMLPVTGLRPAGPVGYEVPPSTGPRFGVFIVLTVDPLSRQPRDKSTNSQADDGRAAGKASPRDGR